MGVEHRPYRGQASTLHQVRDALHKGRVHQPQALRQVRRHHHAAAHGLAVQPLAVAQTGLDGMAKGVAKIENGAQTALALVLRHHMGLDLAAAPHRVRQRGHVAGAQGAKVGLDPIQKRHVGNRPVLDDFGQASAHFTRGQGFERG